MVKCIYCLYERRFDDLEKNEYGECRITDGRRKLTIERKCKYFDLNKEYLEIELGDIYYHAEKENRDLTKNELIEINKLTKILGDD
jgi:hypothetical protein